MSQSCCKDTGSCCEGMGFDMPFVGGNTTPVIGQKIADAQFEIYHEGKISKARLSDYAEKWLIVFFYPADFTFICPTELEEVAGVYDKLKEMDAEVLAVSTDTAFVHKAWHDNSPAIKKVQYPMAADTAHVLSQQFGVLIEDEGLALRGTFIIDPDGVLQAFEVHANNVGRSAEEMVRKLEAAQFVRKHGDLVCPASWKPGKDTLKPGIDLVGKI